MMDTSSFYSTPEWVAVRDLVRERDGHRCSVGRLLGGSCRGVLHVNHIYPRLERPDLALDPENLGTVCAGHHPKWEAVVRLLRVILGEKELELPPCRHRHQYRAGREECDRRRRAALLERKAKQLIAA